MQKPYLRHLKQRKGMVSKKEYSDSSASIKRSPNFKGKWTIFSMLRISSSVNCIAFDSWLDFIREENVRSEKLSGFLNSIKLSSIPMVIPQSDQDPAANDNIEFDKSKIIFSTYLVNRPLANWHQALKHDAIHEWFRNQLPNQYSRREAIKLWRSQPLIRYETVIKRISCWCLNNISLAQESNVVRSCVKDAKRGALKWATKGSTKRSHSRLRYENSLELARVWD